MFKLQHDTNSDTIRIVKEQTKDKNYIQKEIPLNKGVALSNGNLLIDTKNIDQKFNVSKNTKNNIKANNSIKPITSGLNISIKTLRSKDNIPFILRPSTDGELTLLVDETVLSTILNEQPIVTKKNEDGTVSTSLNQNKANKEKDPFAIIVTKEALLELEEFPTNLVQYLDISELEIISQPEQAITKYNNNTELKTIIEAFINEKQSLEDEAKRNNTTCKSCTIGSLNRKYLQKLLPQIPGHSVRLEFYKDIYNTLHCENETKAMQYIKNESLRKINDAYFAELKDAESKPGCTQCKRNGIKTKYTTALSDLIKKNRSDLLLTYE